MLVGVSEVVLDLEIVNVSDTLRVDVAMIDPVAETEDVRVIVGSADFVPDPVCDRDCVGSPELDFVIEAVREAVVVAVNEVVAVLEIVTVPVCEGVRVIVADRVTDRSSDAVRDDDFSPVRERLAVRDSDAVLVIVRDDVGRLEAVALDVRTLLKDAVPLSVGVPVLVGDRVAVTSAVLDGVIVCSGDSVSDAVRDPVRVAVALRDMVTSWVAEGVSVLVGDGVGGGVIVSEAVRESVASSVIESL